MSNTIQKPGKSVHDLSSLIFRAFEKIAPCWPIDQLVGVNPLSGFETLPFENAIARSLPYFQTAQIPEYLHAVNRETIKWCAAFFDEGQAVLGMPLREKGLYECVRNLIHHDPRFNHLAADKKAFLNHLPCHAEEAIVECLHKMDLVNHDWSAFIFWLLTTLPGWASYVRYRARISRSLCRYPVSEVDYVALRMVLTYLMIPHAVHRSDYDHEMSADHSQSVRKIMQTLIHSEQSYQSALMNLLKAQPSIEMQSDESPDAQFVFCIDVRSEPFRRALEAQGHYETFGFAGFFGVPVEVHNEVTGRHQVSCPVLIPPKHSIKETVEGGTANKNKVLNKARRSCDMKFIYQMMMYMVSIPFAWVEVLGFWSGVWMWIRTYAPITARRLKNGLMEANLDEVEMMPCLSDVKEDEGIALHHQCLYAENMLRMIGLTHRFSEIVILCAHHSNTENNAYRSALNCGACGGHSGESNARIMASILNNRRVRAYLKENNIHIPNETIFIAALHDTTTDEVRLYNSSQYMSEARFVQLKSDLKAVQVINTQWRAKKMPGLNEKNAVKAFSIRSTDWAETRPEWGLSRNASFIIGSRRSTRGIDLDGRVFLHSYDWRHDADGRWLESIMTAPLIVAQWINHQYLFSTLDNVAYGSGSKVTQNIVGKIGVFQGNASDLMTGLPLQSVYYTDSEVHHEPMRLLTVVYAPAFRIESIIKKHTFLRNLIQHAWIHLICFDPLSQDICLLKPALSWITLDHVSLTP